MDHPDYKGSREPYAVDCPFCWMIWANAQWEKGCRKADECRRRAKAKEADVHGS